MRTLTRLAWSTSTGIIPATSHSSTDNRWYREHRVPQSKSTVIKNKYAILYLAGQEKMCRLSGMAQRITPQLRQLRQRDQDTYRVLKVALIAAMACISRDEVVN